MIRRQAIPLVGDHDLGGVSKVGARRQRILLRFPRNAAPTDVRTSNHSYSSSVLSKRMGNFLLEVKEVVEIGEGDESCSCQLYSSKRAVLCISA